ncbi:MAG: hypothetical protein U9Q72_02720 [Patescibacteria group bacterium]|nr:hypothetical protein [Patescibacteria group bacterium]
MNKEKFNIVYLASLLDIGVGNIVVEESVMEKRLAEIVSIIEQYGLGSFMAICPTQELNGLSRHLYTKYKENSWENISSANPLRIGETLNMFYLVKTYEGTVLIVNEIDDRISLSDATKMVKQPSGVLFLAICFNKEVDSLIDYFRRKYWSYNIVRVIRHGMKGGKKKPDENERAQTFH